MVNKVFFFLCLSNNSHTLEHEIHRRSHRLSEGRAEMYPVGESKDTGKGGDLASGTE